MGVTHMWGGVAIELVAHHEWIRNAEMYAVLKKLVFFGKQRLFLVGWPWVCVHCIPMFSWLEGWALDAWRVGAWACGRVGARGHVRACEVCVRARNGAKARCPVAWCPWRNGGAVAAAAMHAAIIAPCPPHPALRPALQAFRKWHTTVRSIKFARRQQQLADSLLHMSPAYGTVRSRGCVRACVLRVRACVARPPPPVSNTIQVTPDHEAWYS